MEAYFEESGYGVISCSDSDELIDIISKGRHKPEVFVFYIDGSGRRGYDIIEKVRGISDMAIIVISKDDRLDTQLYAYSKKIDDYMVLPVPLPLLEAHVEAVLRRFSEKKQAVETVGALTIDYESRKIFLEGKTLRVTAKEFDLMEYFIKHKGMILSRDKILDSVWGYDYIGGYRSVDTLVKKLRAKLTKKYPYIQTVYGVGYCFDV
ncbi:MAG: response regulator transcription factor [Clostridiales bacterium]|nr:response regulator transcription factor [Clostridiales bacterium]